MLHLSLLILFMSDSVTPVAAGLVSVTSRFITGGFFFWLIDFVTGTSVICAHSTDRSFTDRFATSRVLVLLAELLLMG